MTMTILVFAVVVLFASKKWAVLMSNWRRNTRSYACYYRARSIFACIFLSHTKN